MGLKGNINADFATVLWVPSTDVGGGILALGAALPLGVPAVDVNAVIVGPRGRAVTITRSEDEFLVGDPLLTAALGWKRGDWSVQGATLLNVPIGDYRAGHLSNLAFNRWALDASVAVTWADEAAGWDISGKTGFTFNGENPSTDYESGTEWHLEGSIEKRLSEKFSIGAQAYYFSQVSGDSGAGATLGPFKGQVTGIGVTAAYNFMLGPTRPASLRLHVMTEMDAKNRLEGDAVFLDFTVPLSMKLPPR